MTSVVLCTRGLASPDSTTISAHHCSLCSLTLSVSRRLSPLMYTDLTDSRSLPCDTRDSASEGQGLPASGKVQDSIRSDSFRSGPVRSVPVRPPQGARFRWSEIRSPGLPPRRRVPSRSVASPWPRAAGNKHGVCRWQPALALSEIPVPSPVPVRFFLPGFTSCDVACGPGPRRLRLTRQVPLPVAQFTYSCDLPERQAASRPGCVPYLSWLGRPGVASRFRLTRRSFL